MSEIGCKEDHKIILHDYGDYSVMEAPATVGSASKNAHDISRHVSSSAATKISCSYKHLSWKPFLGELDVWVNGGLVPVDYWTGLATWLVTCIIHHPDSLLKTLYVRLDNHQNNESAHLFLESIVSSIPTTRLCLYGSTRNSLSLPSSLLKSTVSNHSIEKLQVLIGASLELLYMDKQKKKLKVNVTSTDMTTFIAIKEWLQQMTLISPDQSWLELTVDFSDAPSSENVVLQQFLETLALVKTSELSLFCSPRTVTSTLLSNFILKVLEHNDLLDCLDIRMLSGTVDCFTPKVLEALKHSRLTRFSISDGKLLSPQQQPPRKELEDVLEFNHSLRLLRTKHKVTPRMKMYLELNKNGKRQLLYSKGPTNLTPNQWIDFLVSTNQQFSNWKEQKTVYVDCHGGIHLSCIYFFFRNFSSYYTGTSK